MAEPVDFAGADFVFAAPQGQEDTVRDLPVIRAHGGHYSCWYLTAEEREEIARTGVVWLYIMGQGMYPAAVVGNSPHPDLKPELHMKEDRPDGRTRSDTARTDTEPAAEHGPRGTEAKD